MIKIDMNKIRKHYPSPRSFMQEIEGEKYTVWELGIQDSYCVGGAFILYVNTWHRDLVLKAFPEGFKNLMNFPLSGQMEIVLIEVNPALSREKAEEYSLEIIELNESNDFEAAWQILNKALSYEKDSE